MANEVSLLKSYNIFVIAQKVSCKFNFFIPNVAIQYFAEIFYRLDIQLHLVV